MPNFFSLFLLFALWITPWTSVLGLTLPLSEELPVESTNMGLRVRVLSVKQANYWAGPNEGRTDEIEGDSCGSDEKFVVVMFNISAEVSLSRYSVKATLNADKNRKYDGYFLPKSWKTSKAKGGAGGSVSITRGAVSFVPSRDAPLNHTLSCAFQVKKDIAVLGASIAGVNITFVQPSVASTVPVAVIKSRDRMTEMAVRASRFGSKVKVLQKPGLGGGPIEAETHVKLLNAMGPAANVLIVRIVSVKGRHLSIPPSCHLIDRNGVELPVLGLGGSDQDGVERFHEVGRFGTGSDVGVELRLLFNLPKDLADLKLRGVEIFDPHPEASMYFDDIPIKK